MTRNTLRMKIPDTQDKEEQAATPEVAYVTKLAMRGIRRMREAGQDGGAAVVVLGEDGRAHALGFAVMDPETKTTKATFNLLMALALTYRAKAFACVVEGWQTTVPMMTPEAQAAYKVLIEQGRIPPPSQQPDRREVFWVTRGDSRHTEAGSGPIDGRIETWVSASLDPDNPPLFTLEVFDPATMDEGVRRLRASAGLEKLDLDDMRERARAYLKRTIGPFFGEVDAGHEWRSEG